MARIAMGPGRLVGAVVDAALEAGPAVALAVLTALAAARATNLIHAGGTTASALSGGYAAAFSVAAAVFAVAAAGTLVLLPARPSGDSR
ncbi:hypothetical protein ACIPEL_09980 [Streptomyces griseoviridis]